MTGRWFGRVVICALSVFFAVTVAGSAHAWWDSKWKYRKKVTLDTTAQGADVKDAVADFPVLVRLHTGNFTFKNARNDGSDIRFVASDDKTPLKYHIERYDPSEEMVLIWVKAPRLPAASKDDFIWMYYGNGSAAAGAEPGGAYDTPQLAVYHFSEKEGSPKDATAYGNHAKEFAGKLDSPGPIGRAATLKGGGERLVIGKSPSLNVSKGFTFSAWVRLAGSQDDAHLLSWDDGKQSVIVGIDGTRLYCALSDGKTKTSTGKAGDLPLSRWVHVAVTADPGKDLTIYTDGRERTTQKLGASLPEPGADISVGASAQGKHSYLGDLDEVQIAGISRSVSWVRAAAVGQGPETPLLSYLDEESTSGGEGSLTIHLLIVTAKAVTLDGWLIIGGIAIMIGVTWILFVNKTIALRKMKKENNAFFEVFTSSDDMHAMKDREGEFENSSLYRVYRAGLAEVERRLEKLVGAGKKTLQVHAITAFNTSLEKAALQESKKNTAGLLLFTLSISGGPFMGLFGTVWGVINTFAGVAEAGEANLAAIAPGVASALACTLMGLALAIPALFQYTYLSGEIKNGVADMNVFTGEFSTWVEEEYGPHTGERHA
ncbi:MAG: Biopolymer transport protein ExbB [Syntrophorhabdaceae bacterium PtaU1.Bin034]|nr:MAG: Biopolymer transport protein ExbB [Syntrophorhabdaceae bacterium PtaU1.Bin034]